MANAADSATGDGETIAKRLSGLVAERQRDQYPGGVMVALRSVQRSTISAGRFGPSWSQRLVLAKWVLSGAAGIEYNGRRQRFEPGQVAIYLPTSPHRFWALEQTNRFCWFSTDGPYAEALVRELGLDTGVYRAPPPAASVITAMARSLADRSWAGRRRSSMLAIAEWYRIAGDIGMQPECSLVDRARFIIEQEFANRELSVSAIAGRIGCHRGTLSRVFRQRMGQTVVGYLSEVRCREAHSLLTSTREPLTSIATHCGIRDAAYFCRWIKKLTGLTPRAMRESHHLEGSPGIRVGELSADG